MPTAYDKYYQTENLFGDPHPGLLEFFASYPERGKVLDLGCGQGRNLVPLARLGFEVTGIDYSTVGVEQMNRMAEAEGLKIKGLVGDVFEFEDFLAYDFVLLDSMFHFTKKDREREMAFVKKVISKMKKGSLFVCCIQDTGKKAALLNAAIDFEKPLPRLIDESFDYIFEDKTTGHQSKSKYRMIAVEKP